MGLRARFGREADTSALKSKFIPFSYHFIFRFILEIIRRALHQLAQNPGDVLRAGCGRALKDVYVLCVIARARDPHLRRCGRRRLRRLGIRVLQTRRGCGGEGRGADRVLDARGGVSWGELRLGLRRSPGRTSDASASRQRAHPASAADAPSAPPSPHDVEGPRTHGQYQRCCERARARA